MFLQHGNCISNSRYRQTQHLNSDDDPAAGLRLEEYVSLKRDEAVANMMTCVVNKGIVENRDDFLSVMSKFASS